jgi:hypothetical protein
VQHNTENIKYQGKARDTDKFYKAMAVPTLTRGSKIWTIKKTGSKHLNCRNEILEECRRLHEERPDKIMEELNMLNANVIKSRSQWKYHVQRMEDRWIAKKILSYNPKRKQNIGHPQLRWRSQHTLQETEQTRHGLIHEGGEEGEVGVLLLFIIIIIIIIIV